ncbi:PTS system lactose-specific EIICB component [Labeo rohita]|uniref:PTS system lactose-specific EIICB component n=1 Tax=Labeo rohita TaxID=84645 RepID=A0ABQ8LTV9_LABRO|nr:PTS system lactose-specific EIICB component [Labeo rohita]
MAAGQAGSCLHTMSVLQAYQADLLKELDEGEEIKDSDISELRRTADLSLRATKETARAIGRSMAALVAAERHLWLTLSDMKEKDRVFLLDAPLSPSGLFGDAVNSVVDRYQEARKQAAAFQRFLPRRHPAHRAAGREQPRPSTSSSYRETQKQSVAKRSRSRASQAKPDPTAAPMIKLTRRCLHALDMWRKPWFLSQGPVLGAPCRHVTLATDASLTGWEAVMDGHPARGHKLPGDAGRVSSSETLSPRPERPPCVGLHRQHSGSLLHQPPGRSAFAPLVQTGAPDPCVVPGQTPLAESSLCTWASQFESRHPVEAGAEARGMDASP